MVLASTLYFGILQFSQRPKLNRETQKGRKYLAGDTRSLVSLFTRFFYRTSSQIIITVLANLPKNVDIVYVKAWDFTIPVVRHKRLQYYELDSVWG